MSDREATMLTVDGAPVLRFERRLAHPPEKVWQVITDPAELVHWFPAEVTFQDAPGPGTAMRFVFGEDAPVEPVGSGEVLEFDPPKVFVFRWQSDVLRFEIVPDGAGCVLLFSDTKGGSFGRLAGGRDAAGWEACLASLTARLDGRTAEPYTEWLTPTEHYVEKFGLAEGEVRRTENGYQVYFARDLMWQPEADVWALLTEGGEPRVGAAPPLPATNDYVPAGVVTAFRAPNLLEYQWCHDGAPAGEVRWELTADSTDGHRVELTQTIPAELAGLRATALAAWHVHLELFFAAALGEVRCPWPTGRTDELAARYAAQLADTGADTELG